MEAARPLSGLNLYNDLNFSIDSLNFVITLTLLTVYMKKNFFPHDKSALVS